VETDVAAGRGAGICRRRFGIIVRGSTIRSDAQHSALHRGIPEIGATARTLEIRDSSTVTRRARRAQSVLSQDAGSAAGVEGGRQREGRPAARQGAMQFTSTFSGSGAAAKTKIASNCATILALRRRLGLFVADKLILTPVLAGWKDRAEQIATLRKSVTWVNS
jgi:hypothetical protein